ncbi:MAG: type IV secretion system protein VirB10 [Planctomycetaceae bacterium]|nr:type IV secretion system protein VirB10 [Planctomycetaceae bacterium]
MSDEDINKPENNQMHGNEPIDGDRDIPSVAQNRDFSKLGIMAFIVVGLIAIILVAKDGMEKNNPKLMTEAEEVEYRTRTPSGPYIEIAEPDLPLEQLVPPIDEKELYDPLEAQREFQMRQEALRIAREQKKRMEERRRSPQIIFDEANAGRTTTTPTSSTQGGSLFGGEDDPNIAFANQYANADVETVQASQLQNLGTLITQGTVIDGILETAIQSDLPGMVRAIVSENVYSFDGSSLVIPKGSKLVGRYRSTLTRGQSRVFVIWSRLIRNDGVSINIGSYGTDDLGRSGLAGVVDTHFFERFGSSVLLSLIDTGLQIGVNAVDDADQATVALETGSDFSRSAEIALENSVGIPPTVHVHQGSRIKVFVGKDLDFSEVAGNVRR